MHAIITLRGSPCRESSAIKIYNPIPRVSFRKALHPSWKPLKPRAIATSSYDSSYDEGDSKCVETSIQRVAEAPNPSTEPPHHTDDLPDSLFQPARMISDSLIIINTIIFILQLASPDISMFGIKDNDLIDQGQVWRFITPAFLHGSPTHLILNMLSLHSLGPITEWTCGRERFMTIYLIAAVMGNVASYFGDDLPSLGASGAIFGLAGALSVYFWRNKSLFGTRFDGLQHRLWLVIVLNLGSGLVLPQIDEWGHLGGLLGGALAAFLLGPKYEICRVKGRDGVWLIDEPPLEALATPPRQVLKELPKK